MAAGSIVCWPYSQGRKALGSAGRAADQVRNGHQSQDGKGTGPHDPADVVGACRRGVRIESKRNRTKEADKARRQKIYGRARDELGRTERYIQCMSPEPPTSCRIRFAASRSAGPKPSVNLS